MRFLAKLFFTFLLDLRPSSFLHLKVVTIVSPRRIFNCLWNLMIPLPPSSCSVLLLLLLLAPPTPISDHGTREVVATLETRTWISSYCETLPRYTVTSTKYVWGLGYAPSYDKLTFATTSTIGSGVRFRCVSIPSTNPGEMECRLVSR